MRKVLALSIGLVFPGLCAPSALPALIREARVVGQFGSTEALKEKALVLSPGITVPRTGMESTLEVSGAWNGDRLDLEVKRVSSNGIKFLAVRIVLDPACERFTFGAQDVPVPLPVKSMKRGAVMETWAPNTPWWILAENGGVLSSALLQTEDGHGFVVSKNDLGETQFDLRLRLPGSGETRKASLRFASGQSVAQLRVSARSARGFGEGTEPDHAAASRLRGQGFVRVDGNGTGFATFVDGKPWYALGSNDPNARLYLLPAAEQDRILRRMRDAGMTLVRFIVYDWVFHPFPGCWNGEAFQNLRASIERAASYGIRTILCLRYSQGIQYSSAWHLAGHVKDNIKDALAAEGFYDWYQEGLALSVKPLVGDPAVMAITAINEPANLLGPQPGAVLKLERYRKWLEGRYPSCEALGKAWGMESPSGFATVLAPSEKEMEEYRTAAARDYFLFDREFNARCASDLLVRLKAVDTNHLLSISDRVSRAIKGLPGGALIDFWAPHDYDVYATGPAIRRHLAQLGAYMQGCLPDRGRPMFIEEFGLQKMAKFPLEMRSRFVADFLDFAPKLGYAGALVWWEMEEEYFAAYRAAQPFGPLRASAASPVLAVFLADAQEYSFLWFSHWKPRKRWEKILGEALDAGFTIKFVGTAKEAAKCDRMLVLGKFLEEFSPAEQREIKAVGSLPILLESQAAPLKMLVPAAALLPDDEAKLKGFWEKQRS